MLNLVRCSHDHLTDDVPKSIRRILRFAAIEELTINHSTNRVGMPLVLVEIANVLSRILAELVHIHVRET